MSEPKMAESLEGTLIDVYEYCVMPSLEFHLQKTVVPGILYFDDKRREPKVHMIGWSEDLDLWLEEPYRWVDSIEEEGLDFSTWMVTLYTTDPHAEDYFWRHLAWLLFHKTGAMERDKERRSRFAKACAAGQNVADNHLIKRLAKALGVDEKEVRNEAEDVYREAMEAKAKELEEGGKR